MQKKLIIFYGVTDFNASYVEISKFNAILFRDRYFNKLENFWVMYGNLFAKQYVKTIPKHERMKSITVRQRRAHKSGRQLGSGDLVGLN